MPDPDFEFGDDGRAVPAGFAVMAAIAVIVALAAICAPILWLR